MPSKRTRRGRQNLHQRPRPWDSGTSQMSREYWQHWRRYLMECSPPGTRPAGWWLYESPEPRSDENETLQLYRLGELTGAELETVKGWWADAEEQAAKVQALCVGYDPVNYCGVWIEGEEAYRRWRMENGVPDDLFPPRTAEALAEIRRERLTHAD